MFYLVDCRKLVLLKLEKGEHFGDAVLDTNTKKTLKTMNTESNIVVSTSIFKEVKSKEKKLKLLSTEKIISDYKKYWTENEQDSTTLISCQTNKEAIEKSCDSTFQNDMTICHLDLKDVEEGKKLKKAKKWTKTMWSHTSKNGLFVSVWTGSPTQNAFVGIAINKAISDE